VLTSLLRSREGAAGRCSSPAAASMLKQTSPNRGAGGDLGNVKYVEKGAYAARVLCLISDLLCSGM
jgi:hypothetical protein